MIIVDLEVLDSSMEVEGFKYLFDKLESRIDESDASLNMALMMSVSGDVVENFDALINFIFKATQLARNSGIIAIIQKCKK